MPILLLYGSVIFITAMVQLNIIIQAMGWHVNIKNKIDKSKHENWKNYPNKITHSLFNFEVNAEVSCHCLNFIKDIYALRSGM